jgi:predicted Zn-dependent peptidase
MNTNRALTLLLALAMIAGSAIAQMPGGQDKAMSVSKVVRMNKAPVSKDILRVKLPKPIETTLDNGLTVLIMEDHRFPTVFVLLQIDGAGGFFDPQDMPGLASATASLMREGTKTRNSRQIAEDIDKLGATLNAFAGFGQTTAASINASGLSDNLDDWFALLNDILMNPTFPADELEKYKARQKVQMKQQRAQPQMLVVERFNKAVYGNHPGSVSMATESSIDAMSSEKLAAWHKERYVPQSAILGIAGDVDPKALIPKLKQWFGGWRKTNLKVALPPDVGPAQSKKVYLVDRPNSVQTTITMGNLTIDRTSPDYIPFNVMNRVVGGGPAARLFINLREEKGYTYGVYSSLFAPKYRGDWTAGGDVRSEVTEGAMTEFMKELNRIRDEKVPESELDECKRSLVANFALSLEQPTQLLNYGVTRKYYGLPEDYWDTYPAKIMSVTADDVQNVARKYVQPESIQIVAVGDAARIKDVMAKFGPVEIYDTEGKMKQ